MRFSVTILGTSSAVPTAQRFQTAHVLNVHERFFLIDCAEATQIQLRRNGISINKIEQIFISHQHGDHCLGLFGLIATSNLLGRTKPLHIYAPPALHEIIKINNQFFNHELKFDIIFHPLDTEKNQTVFEDKELTVSTLPLNHRVPCCGFLFAERPGLPNVHKQLVVQHHITPADIWRIKQGADFTTPEGLVIANNQLTYTAHPPRTYAYCSDTLFIDKLAQLIENVDLMYHEATFMHRDLNLAQLTGHSTAQQAATVAQLANAKKLLIGHFSSRYKNVQDIENEARSIFPNTFAVNDGDKFEIEN